MKNLEIWESLCTPPKEALKKIVAGRLRGMSDINPQWRLKAMTEVFGPVGFGWKYSVDKMWLEPGSNEQVCAFAMVSVMICRDGEWSQPIPGIGGSMLIAKEKSGLHTSDEAYKMAVTDALSVALKAIGVAGDVYMGMLDGSKYSKKPSQQQNGSFSGNEKPKLLQNTKAWNRAVIAYKRDGNLNAVEKHMIVSEEDKKLIIEGDSDVS